MTRYEPVCPGCDQCPDDSFVRGIMTQANDDVLVVRSVFYCEACCCYHGNVVRIIAKEGGYVVEWLSEEDGWVRTEFLRKNPIRGFFARLFGKKQEKVIANV